ncbi:MAG: four helix bundle protein [Bacteroidia bacterium]|nr:four helix bundle protein [Bacteroidia bacterium]
MRNFRKLEVWVDALDLAKDVYSFKDQLPKSEIYGLSSQLCRAVVSISSNLAEGCSRKSEKEFVRFIEIAMGSAFEVESLLILSKELELATNFDYQPISLKLEKLQKKNQCT